MFSSSGTPKQRRQRAIGGDVAAAGIVGDRDRHRRRLDQSLKGTQTQPELVGIQRVDRIESRSIKHDPGTGDSVADGRSCMSWARPTAIRTERESSWMARTGAAGQLDFTTVTATILRRRYITSLPRSNQPGQRAVAYTRKLSTDHGRGLSALSVCVIRMNLARTGLNVATVVAGEPFPSATGVPHALPSIDTCTR